MFKKICVIGDGITAQLLAQMLLNLNLRVDLYSNFDHKFDKYSNRTLAISPSNVDYLKKIGIFNKNKKAFWNVNSIKLFLSDENKTKKIIEFNKKPIFTMFKYNDLFFDLKKTLIKKFNFKTKKNFNYEKLKNQYSLIINCDHSNYLFKSLLYKKIKKNYQSKSLVSIINHLKIKNDTAYQFFCDEGPMAFLPISNTSTSIVWSIKKDYFLKEKNLLDLFFKKKVKEKIKNYFKIKSFKEINSFNLAFEVPRNYFKKNVLNFGSNLHQIHPLTGQGFNMIIRDIKLLEEKILYFINLGLDLNTSVLEKFSKESKSYNFLFAQGIDFTEKYFTIKNKKFNSLSNFLMNKIDENKKMKEIFINLADKGLNLKTIEESLYQNYL